MVEGTEVIQPGDKIKISCGQFQHASDIMIVEWVTNKEGVKEIWVHRDTSPSA